MTDEPIFNYRECLVGVGCVCQYAADELIGLGFTLTRFGELKDIFELFDEGEEYKLPFSLLHDSELPQIKGILRIFELLDAFCNYFYNINAIGENLIEEAYNAEVYLEYLPSTSSVPIDTELDARYRILQFVSGFQLSLFDMAYMLSHATTDLPNADFNPYNEHPERLVPMDLTDQNVVLLFELMQTIRQVFPVFELDD